MAGLGTVTGGVHVSPVASSMQAVVSTSKVPHYVTGSLGVSNRPVQNSDVKRPAILSMLGQQSAPASGSRSFVNRTLELLKITEDGADVARKEVPVIDFSGIENDPGRRRAAAADLRKASEEWGVYWLVNHSVAPSLIKQMRETAQEFMNFSLEKKSSFVTPQWKAARVTEGYASHSFNVNTLKSSRELLYFNTQPVEARNMDDWPTEPALMRELMAEYSDAVSGLSTTLMQLLSESLDLPSSYIGDAMKDENQSLIVNYYPHSVDGTSPGEQLLGATAHTDPGVVTVLLLDGVPGLQLWKDGGWVTADSSSASVPEGALLVQSGDILQFMTNGRFPSSYHRVLSNAQKSRLSIAVGVKHQPWGMLSTIPQLIDDDHPAIYCNEVSCKDYYANYYKGSNDMRPLETYRLSNLSVAS